MKSEFTGSKLAQHTDTEQTLTFVIGQSEKVLFPASLFFLSGQSNGHDSKDNTRAAKDLASKQSKASVKGRQIAFIYSQADSTRHGRISSLDARDVTQPVLQVQRVLDK